MKILIVTQYFWPEYFLINKLSEKLSGLGHEVVVATGKPNYPEGNIYSGYSSSGVVTELVNGVNVLRIPLRPRGKGLVNLALNYLSFIVSGVLFFPRLLKGMNFDVIFVFAPSPITAVIPAIWLNRKLKSHLVLWVQDLWPQSLFATGYIKNAFVLSLVGRLVRWIYNQCDTLLAQSHSFIGEIKKYTKNNNVFYYPNSIEDQFLASEAVNLPADIAAVLNGGFKLVFAGNIGSAQSIPTLISAASRLQDTDCRFIFVGDGSVEEWAKNEVKKLNLSNVSFIRRVDNSLIRPIYEAADGLILSLASSEIFSYTVPGKLQSYLASGKPIIASLNGEAADIVFDAKAGVVAPAENSEALEKAIRNFRALSQSERDVMGIAGRRYFKKNFDMDILVRDLVEIFKRRIVAS